MRSRRDVTVGFMLFNHRYKVKPQIPPLQPSAPTVNNNFSAQEVHGVNDNELFSIQIGTDSSKLDAITPFFFYRFLNFS